MNDFYVYMYLRSYNSKHGVSGSPYYIGKGRGNRVISNNRKITHRPADSSNIVYFATDLTEWDAFQLEMLLIYRFGRIDNGTGSLRNLTDGGEGQCGRIQPAEEKQRKSEWMKANPNRGQFVVSGPSLRKGVGVSDEAKAKQSASWTPEKRKAMGDKHRGKKHSSERIAKNRASKLGVKQSEETIQKRADANRGQKRAPYKLKRTREEAHERRKAQRRELYALRKTKVETIILA
jgi:hypothetical protein